MEERPVLLLTLCSTRTTRSYWVDVRRLLKKLLRGFDLRCVDVRDAPVMTKFRDGPAQGQKIELGRAPLYLRVVRAASGEWDGLDQLLDLPEPGEAVTVYRKVSDDGRFCLRYTDRRKRLRTRWLATATYALSDAQPDDATTRDVAMWRGWCLAMQEETTP